MSGRFPYEKRYKYPHMIGDDLRVWEKFIELHPGRFDSVDYDWRVGVGMTLYPEWEENIKRMAKMITQKRIDVVGWNDEQPTIIEVKERGSIVALGQLLGYLVLFVKEFPNISAPKLLLICDMISLDDRTALDDYEIEIEVV